MKLNFAGCGLFLIGALLICLLTSPAQAANELRQDLQLVDQTQLMLGNGADLHSIVQNGTRLEIDAPVVSFSTLLEIQGGSPAANRVLTSDANGLAAWADLGSIPGGTSEWGMTANVIHPDVATEDVAIGGTTEVGADIFFGNDGRATFNEQGNSVDFTVEGNTDVSLFVVDGSADNVGIGTASPGEKLQVNGNVLVTGSMSANTIAGDGSGLTNLDAGDIASGTLASARGGTGVDNTGGSLDFGNFALTLTTSALTNVTLPTTGTLATVAGTETLTNKIIQADPGSDAAPTISFDTDTDSGWFSAGADLIAVATGGVEALRIDDAQNVGIGFADPSRAKLEVNGQILLAGGSPAANRVLTSDANGLAAWADLGSLPGGTSEWGMTANVIHPDVATEDVAIGGTSEAGSDIFFGNDGRAKFNEQGNSVDFAIEGNTDDSLFVVDGSADNVGIGTDAPGEKLQVNGNVLITGSMTSNTVVGDGSGLTNLEAGDIASGTLASARGGTGVDNTGGSLDFGNFALTLATTAGTNVTLPTTGTLATLAGTETLTNKTFQADAGSAASPTITFDDDTNTGAFSAATDTLGLSVAGSEAMRIIPNGNIGIGETVPIELLHVAGNERLTGDLKLGGSIIQDSDLRLKSNIIKIPNALEKVQTLRGVTYTWNDNELNKNKDHRVINYGVIAQEVEAVFPDLVEFSTGDYKTVDYIGLIPTLIEAIKDQQEMILDLQEENEDLKSQLDEIEAKLDR